MMLKKLREMTNVGMMDCKKALTASDGDMDKAVEWLREKGLAAAAKKSGRIAAEGVVNAIVWKSAASALWSRSTAETDFCVEVRSVRSVRQGYLPDRSAEDNPADVEAIKDMQVSRLPS